MPRNDSLSGRRLAPQGSIGEGSLAPVQGVTHTPTTIGRETEIFEGGGLQQPLIDPIDIAAGYGASKLIKPVANVAAQATVPAKKALKFEIPETRGQGQFFHGTPKELEKVSSQYYSGRNIYGEGFYTTDDLTTAMSYRKKGAVNAVKEGTHKPRVYQVQETQPVKFYDMDAPITPTVAKALQKASNFSESIGAGLDELRSGNASTLAEIFDTARKESSSLGESADTVIEGFELVRESLQREGFGGFTHIGGKLTKTGRPHQVKIYWTPENQINISRVK